MKIFVIDRNYDTCSVPVLKCKLTRVCLLGFPLAGHLPTSEAEFKFQNWCWAIRLCIQLKYHSGF